MINKVKPSVAVRADDEESTFAVLNVRDHRQVCVQKGNQRPIRLGQPRIAGETKMRVTLDFCKRRDPLAVTELPIQPIDTLRFAVRQVSPYLITHRRGHALLKQFADFLALPRVRRWRR